MIFCRLCNADFPTTTDLRNHLAHHNLGWGDPAPLLALLDALDAPASDLKSLLTELRTED